jgi:ABC-type dipeptide/oligopeptide/nickel transport system permease component
MESVKSKSIPVFWFGLTLVLWVFSYWVAFSRSAEHTQQIVQFMAAGGRFTQEEGDALETRIFLLELQVEELYYARGDNEKP